jgi:hypothetical protein
VELKPHRMSTVLTITLWDKDTLGRDYMGEVNIPLQHMFTRNCPPDPHHDGGWPLSINDPRNQPVWYKIQSKNAISVSGYLAVRIGLLDKQPRSDEEWGNFWSNICAQYAKA